MSDDRPAAGVRRAVDKVVTAIHTVEGEGFPVRRPFARAELSEVDPFLMLDEMGPKDWPPGEAILTGDHPHRGFETVTYLLQGQVAHRDSQDHHGLLGPGDVQWMTAGAGVVHSEKPGEAFKRAGGVLHGFQLWVNLPARDKMIAPRYQDTPAARIPEVSADGGRARARVIAGQALGQGAVIDTRIPITFLHLTLEPGATWRSALPPDQNALVYVFGGELRADAAGMAVGDGQLAVMGPGDLVELSAAPDATGTAQALLLSGRPIREAIAWHGPFVMNTREELIQAFRDYQSGRMGQIAGA